MRIVGYQPAAGRRRESIVAQGLTEYGEQERDRQNRPGAGEGRTEITARPRPTIHSNALQYSLARDHAGAREKAAYDTCALRFLSMSERRQCHRHPSFDGDENMRDVIDYAKKSRQGLRLVRGGRVAQSLVG